MKDNINDEAKMDAKDEFSFEMDGYEDEGARMQESEVDKIEREKKTISRFTINKPMQVRKFPAGLLQREEEKLIRSGFTNNRINTAKYTWYNFIPLNGFEQIKKMSNAYFIILSILQIIPATTVTDGVPSLLLPLMIVILASMAKDFVEDRKRQNSDTYENNSKVLVLNAEGGFDIKKWEDLQVGEIVKIIRDGQFPADLILINSSSPKGICYVETKNLDGETNLKYKISRKETIDVTRSEISLKDFYGTVTCEVPNALLYNYEGTLNMDNEIIPLSADQLLLRGSLLKNTEYIYGIVVYTGSESKIQMNSSKARPKRSKIESMTHKQIVIIFMGQILISIILAVMGMTWIEINSDWAKGFLEFNSSFEDKALWRGFRLFIYWLLMSVQLVPLSLLLTVEVIRYLQGLYIGWDSDMYDPKMQMPAVVQSSNLNEELGSVNYIFSDKTGTLTCNIMEFKKLAVGKKRYGSSAFNMRPVPGISNVNFVSPEMLGYLNNEEHRQSKRRQKIEYVCIFLALCHTALVEETDKGSALNSSSPDELALVSAAKYFGYEFTGRDENGDIIIQHEGEITRYPLLNVLEFNSTRKRMSVIVKLPDGKIALLCKGADNVIYERLNPHSKYRKEIQDFMMDCGGEGLRTLVLAHRIIPESQYEEWNKKYQEAMRAVNNRGKLLDEVAELIEKDMLLLGSTAIEDKLQEKVGETISFIKKAGIKFWVLTGDKVETAVNISFSCKLLTKVSIIRTVDAMDSEEVYNQISKIAEEVESFKGIPHKLKRFALVITGDALLKATKHKKITEPLIKVCRVATMVVACRVSPKQKAEIVKLVRDNDTEAITLSIGDGANDVNMISEAHIGIGIRGLEGQQAARASDYAITKFRHLKNLLFVHGREATRKNAFAICYCFYKNMLLVVPILVYCLWSGGSAQALYNEWLYQLYNTVLTTAPIAYFASLDKEYERPELLSNPKLYETSRKGEYFNYVVFWRWIGYGTIQGILVFIVVFYTLANCPTSDQGYLDDLPLIGNVIFTIVVLAVNFRMLVDHNTHTSGSFFLAIGSAMIYYPLYYFISLSKVETVYQTFGRMFKDPIHIFLQVLLIVVLLLIEIVLQQIERFLYKYYSAIKSHIKRRQSESEISTTAFSIS